MKRLTSKAPEPMQDQKGVRFPDFPSAFKPFVPRPKQQPAVPAPDLVDPRLAEVSPQRTRHGFVQ